MLRVRKVLADGPFVVVASLLWVSAAAVVPDPFGGVVLVGLMLAGVLLFCGVGERTLTRLLWRARPISPVQWRMLLASVEHIDPAARVYVVRGASVDVFPVGRDGLLVTSGFLDAVMAGRLRPPAATALLVGACGQLAAGVGRRAPAIRAWTLPLLVVAPPLGAVAGVGLFRAGWKLRAFVIVVAVVQAFLQGLWWLSGALAGFLVLTYLVPWWRRRWEAASVAVFDDAVLAAGRGDDLARWLRQVGGCRQRDRIIALENPHLRHRSLA